MTHNDRIIKDGFPDGWYVQDRLDENTALLCRSRDLLGPSCICLRPRATATDDWLATARLIAKGFDAATRPPADLAELIDERVPDLYRTPEILHAAFVLIDQELERVRWNNLQTEVFSPFSNSGQDWNYDGKAFSVHAFSWGDEEQPWNFKWRELEINWYKRMGGDMTSNIPVTADMVSRLLNECLDEVRALDDEDHSSSPGAEAEEFNARKSAIRDSDT